MEAIQNITTNPDLSPTDKVILCYLNSLGVKELETTLKELSHEINIVETTLYQNIYHMQKRGYLVFDNVHGAGIILSDWET
jgi:hypothetical protein